MNRKKIYKIIAVMLIIMIYNLCFSNIITAVNTKHITLVLDPGHGGSSPGAINYSAGLVERDLTLKIAKYLKEYLSKYDNLTVIMTHEELPSNEEMTLKEIGMTARRNNADMLISLHLNSSTSSNLNGAEVFVTNCDLLPKYKQESTKLGNKILNKLNTLGIANRGVKTRLCNDTGPKWEYSDGSRADYYGVIRHAMKGDTDDRGADLQAGEGIPGMIIEHCYIKNGDERFLDSEEDLKKLAKADCDAIVEYYGLVLKDDTKVKSVYLENSDITLLKGDKMLLEAVVLPTSAKNKEVTWKSKDDRIVSVNSNGEIIAKSAGKTQIVVTTKDGAKTATANVKVQDISLKTSNTEVNLLEGYKFKVLVDMEPISAYSESITWSSSNSNIAKVDKNGVIEAIKSGQTNIIGKINDKSINVKVNVNKLNESQNIKWKNINDKNALFTDVKESTKIESLKNNITLSDNLESMVVDGKGNKIDEKDNLATGMRIIVQEKNSDKKLQEYQVVLYGDISKDGKIDAMDMFKLRQILLKNTNFDRSQLEAANMSKDEQCVIDAMDMFKLRQYLMMRQ